MTAEVVIVGGGPGGLTAGLLLARAGHRVTILEADSTVGGLWAAKLDAQGRYVSENSCKVYQASYHTAPALFRLIGTRWEDHFTPRHDLARDWLRPFVADSSWADLGRLAGAYGLHVTGLRDFRSIAVAEWLSAHAMSESFQAWMRATALGGITGTLRMTMWELFHRLGGNVSSILSGRGGTLYWNTRPPNAPSGFVSLWSAALRAAGATVLTGCRAVRLTEKGGALSVALEDGAEMTADAVFLAVPPRALTRLFEASPPAMVARFGRDAATLRTHLDASVYEHLGIVWSFPRSFERDLPLGGHNVRSGWHAILVQHDQYREHLAAPAVTTVVGSVSLATELRHPRLGTRARDHTPDELARILWADERAADPGLPEPVGYAIHGMSDATQIVDHGPLPLKADGAEVYLATNMSGAAPYFTASLESAIQAGAAAAFAFDARVERLPTGPGGRHSWGGAPVTTAA